MPRYWPSSFAAWWRTRRFNARPLSAQIGERQIGTAAPSQSGRLCLFAHHDPDGIVDPYVFHYLRRLRDLDADLVFVSTAPALRREDVERLRPLCRHIVRRVNVSADFGSWILGLHLLAGELAAYRQLILANDSVYGPFRDLAPIFAEMESRRLGVWSLTENHKDSPHLQSYFLVFERSALNSAFFRQFRQSFRQESNKRRLILANEIGLSVAARAEGLRCASWLGCDQVGSVVNPTLFHWEEIIERLGFPFLKTEILKTNRFKSERAADWRRIIGAVDPDYDCELIAGHLRRVGSAVPVDIPATMRDAASMA